MPVANVRDRRTNDLDVNVDVVIECSWHDNGTKGSSFFEVPKEHDREDFFGFVCVEASSTTVATALLYAAHAWPDYEMTVCFYDPTPEEPGCYTIDPRTLELRFWERETNERRVVPTRRPSIGK